MRLIILETNRSALYVKAIRTSVATFHMTGQSKPSQSGLAWFGSRFADWGRSRRRCSTPIRLLCRRSSWLKVFGRALSTSGRIANSRLSPSSWTDCGLPPSWTCSPLRRRTVSLRWRPPWRGTGSRLWSSPSNRTRCISSPWTCHVSSPRSRARTRSSFAASRAHASLHWFSAI